VTALQLTADHTARCPLEQARIEALGGTISHPCSSDDSHRVNNQLEVTRSLGDCELKDVVRADAEVLVRAIQPGDRFVVIASDGLWDVVNNQDAVRAGAEGGVDGRVLRVAVEARLRKARVVPDAGSGRGMAVASAHLARWLQRSVSERRADTVQVGRGRAESPRE